MSNDSDSLVFMDVCEMGATEASGALHLTFVVSGALTTACTLLGVLGNVASLWYIRQTQFAHRSLSTALSALAIWDAQLLLCSFAYYGLLQLWPLFGPLGAGRVGGFKHISSAFHPLAHTAYIASAWLTVWLSHLQRRACRAPQPAAARSCGSPLSCVHFNVPVGVSVAALVVAAPIFMETRVGSCFNVQAGRVDTRIEPTALRLDWRYQWLYRVSGRLFFITLGPLVVIATLVADMRRQRRLDSRARRRRQLVQNRLRVSFIDPLAASDAARSLRKSSLLMTILLSKFLLSHTAPALLDVWEALLVAFGRRPPPPFYYIMMVSSLLVVVNSATNCLVFIVGRAAMGRQRAETSVVDLSPMRAFSSAEAATLANAWAELQASSDVGGLVMEAVFAARPDLGGVRSRSSSTPQQVLSAVRPRLATVGRVASLQHSATGDLRRAVAGQVLTLLQTLVDNLVGRAGWEQSEAMLRRAGAAHYEHGVNFDEAAWREAAGALLRVMADAPNLTDERRRLWRRFVGILICEMKVGFMAVVHLENQLYQPHRPKTVTTSF